MLLFSTIITQNHIQNKQSKHTATNIFQCVYNICNLYMMILWNIKFKYFKFFSSVYKKVVEWVKVKQKICSYNEIKIEQLQTMRLELNLWKKKK